VKMCVGRDACGRSVCGCVKDVCGWRCVWVKMSSEDVCG
jgi:hypothetical protein